MKLCFVAVVLVIIGSAFAQNAPISPCPRIFRYETDGTQWYGIIEIPSPGFNSVSRLDLVMSMNIPLPTSYTGRIELLGERSELLHELLNGGSFRYRVHFPLFDVVPRVVDISFNRKSLCSGSAGSGKLTFINLNHSLRTPQASHQQSNTQYVRPQSNQDFNNNDYIIFDGNNYNPNQNSFNNNNFNNLNNNNYNNLNSNNYNYNNKSQNGGNFNNIIVQTKPLSTPENYETQIFSWTSQPSTPQAPTAQGPFSGSQVPTAIDNNYSNNNFQNSEFIDDKPSPDNFAQRPAYSPLNQKDDEANRPVANTNNQYPCGVSKKISNALIVGGDKTNKGDWPWITAMFMKKVSGLNFICSGSLVSNKHVVTAAHCVRQKNNRPVQVSEIVLKLGAFNLQDWADDTVKFVEVRNIILHEKFEGGLALKDDIAILVIKYIAFTDYIIPVCLWSGNTDLSQIVGRQGSVVGWGRDENGYMATPEPKLAVVPIVSTEECRASKVEFHYLTSELTLCAGAKDGTGPCNGDSGGGLYLPQSGRWTLRGIVSNSLKDPESLNTCDVNQYVVYTDSAKYLKWIQDTMNSN